MLKTLIFFKEKSASKGFTVPYWLPPNVASFIPYISVPDDGFELSKKNQSLTGANKFHSLFYFG